MNAKASSVILASVLAFAGSQAQILAADPVPHASVEAADRQFLAALENGEPAPAPVASGAPDTHSEPAPPPKKHVAPKSSAPAIVKKEGTSTRVANAAPKKSAPVVKREARRAPEEIEVRRAIPVTVTTTTTTYGTSVDRDDDDDHDHDEDDDHDHDRHDGFFDRLFRGEKVFR